MTMLQLQVQQAINPSTVGSGVEPIPAFFGSSDAPFSELSPVHPVIVKHSLIASVERFGLRAQPENKGQREAVLNRLVKASKSPTGQFRGIESARSALKIIPTVDDCFVGPRVHTRVDVDASAYPETHLRESKGPGQYTVVQFREWSEEYRIRTRVDFAKEAPQAPEGDRVSVMLSDRGARSIADSAHYMALQKGGYQTFITPTFDAEKRAAIASGATSIQKEVTRCMDAMQKMYQRGWTTPAGKQIASTAALVEVERKVKGEKVTKIEREGLCYCWVVEIPKNEAGEDNPHVHMMMNWKVEFEDFSDWAARLESIWGNGSFHIQKIECPEFAGAYMAKAAGYLTKGKESDQGRVVGNRYGISKPARAPGWACMGEYELGVMGRLIAEVAEHIEQKYAKQRQQRRMLAAQRDKAPKKSAERAKIGARLAKVREELNAVEVRASKYQLVCKGREAFNKFLGWSVSAGWQPDYRPDSIWITEFNRQRGARKKRAFYRRLSPGGVAVVDRVGWCEFEFSAAVKEYDTMPEVGRSSFDWGGYESMEVH